MSSLFFLVKTISLSERIQFYFAIFVICASVYIIIRSLQYFFGEGKRDKGNQKKERSNLVSLIVGILAFVVHCNILLRQIA